MLSMQPTLFFVDLVADAIEAAITGGTVKVAGLFTNDPSTLNKDTVLADLTEPTFTGYARVAVAVGTRRTNVNGDQISPLGKQTFQPTATPASPQTVNGWFLEVDGDLYGWDAFTSPFTFTTTGDALDVISEIITRCDTIWGGVCTTCPTL